MAGTTPLLGITYPAASDAASPAGIQTAITQAEKYLVAVFASTAARDTAWTAATGLSAGRLAYITGTGELQLYTGSAWIVIGGRQSPYAVAAGIFSPWAINAGSSTSSTNITFPAGRFSQIPIVFLSHDSAGGGTFQIILRPSSITTTGFTYNFTKYDNSALGTAITGESAGWLALQMTASAANG